MQTDCLAACWWQRGFISEIKKPQKTFFFFRGAKSLAKLLLANNSYNLEELDFCPLLPPKEIRAANGFNTDSANRKAEPRDSFPASNSFKVSQLWLQFSVPPISGWYCQMLQITAQVGIEEKGRKGFLRHIPLSITEHDKNTVLSSVLPGKLF